MLFQNFKALKLKLNDTDKPSHFIFFKEHSVREVSEKRPAGRTLFVLNIPPYVDEQGLKNAFSKAGKVSSVLFTEKPSPQDTDSKQQNYFTELTLSKFRYAYIVFEKVSYLDKALQLSNLHPLVSNNYSIKCGLSKWVENYNSRACSIKDLKSEINDFMRKFDENKMQEELKEKALEADDEGWMTVTKKGKFNSFARTEKVENKILEKEEKGKKRKELQNFYTFQIRESKMKRIVALRQKFEEDKLRIQQLKSTRRFKPF